MSGRAPDETLDAFVRGAGLLRPGEAAQWTPLRGGVSGEIWRVDGGAQPFCVKRALARLNVAADWRVPVERNLYEWRWLETVAALFPDNVPAPLAADETHAAFAMSYLPAADYPLWKTSLLAGDISIDTATRVGEVLGAIHAATAHDAALAAQFATDHLFAALRIDPYLMEAARLHPDCAARLTDIAEETMRTRVALVHGDISPKNILVGAAGPVFLDAECAWYGDPAFDLAFCLNHLVLKAFAAPARASALLACFDALHDSYVPHVQWERPEALQRRAGALLGGLLLARIDGKSPVEYITVETVKMHVRALAKSVLQDPAATAAAVRDAAAIALGAHA